MTFKLNKHESAAALHVQLMTHLRERILAGSYPPGMRLPTELELAQEHQISRVTVRQALSLLVNEGLLQRVQGRGTFVCQSPLVSEAKVQRGEKRIGVVLNRPSTAQLNTDILIGVEQAAKSHGYHISFTYTEENQEQQARDIVRLLADHISGLIIFPLSNTLRDESVWRLQAEHVPFVLIDRYFPDLQCSYVGADNFAGGYRATEHLLILGHTRISFVNPHPENLLTTSVHDRWQGYRHALATYGVPYDETLVSPQTSMSTIEAQKYYIELMTRADRPDAIFAANDFVALSLLRAAQTCSVRIPEEIALVGFDDLGFAAQLHPALTTVAQPFMDIGLRAGTLLISHITGQVVTPGRIELPTNLVVRESCGAQLHIKRSLSETKAL